MFVDVISKLISRLTSATLIAKWEISTDLFFFSLSMKPISRHYSWRLGVVANWDGQGIVYEEAYFWTLMAYCVPNRQPHFIQAKPSQAYQISESTMWTLYIKGLRFFFYHSSIKHCSMELLLSAVGSQTLQFHKHKSRTMFPCCIITWLLNTI